MFFISKYFFDFCKITIIFLSFSVADKFSLDGLRTLATFLINEKINANNVVDTYVAASNSFPILG